MSTAWDDSDRPELYIPPLPQNAGDRPLASFADWMKMERSESWLEYRRVVSMMYADKAVMATVRDDFDRCFGAEEEPDVTWRDVWDCLSDYAITRPWFQTLSLCLGALLAASFVRGVPIVVEGLIDAFRGAFGV